MVWCTSVPMSRFQSRLRYQSSKLWTHSRHVHIFRGHAWQAIILRDRLHKAEHFSVSTTAAEWRWVHLIQDCLTHWDRDKMAAILQMAFSNSLSDFIHWIPGNKPKWTLKQNMIIFMRETENAISKTASFLVSASNRCNGNDIIQIQIMSSRSGLKGPDCFEISKRYSIFTSFGSEFHKMRT